MHRTERKRAPHLAARLLAAAVLAGGALAQMQDARAQGPGAGPGHGPGMGWGRDWWMPRWMDRHHWNPRGMGPDMNARMQRHWTYMHEGLPAEYAGQRSTVAANEATVAEGGKLYAANCASCHGKTGLGDGEAGKSLAPSPALLAYLIQRPVAADEYLLWSIAEGGKAFGTGMPAFKDTLKRDDIWRIVGYMRAGFPEVKDGAAGKAK